MSKLTEESQVVLKLLPLQGDRLPPKTTQGDALGYELLPLQGVLGIGLSLTAYHKRITSAPSGRVGDWVIINEGINNHITNIDIHH